MKTPPFIRRYLILSNALLFSLFLFSQSTSITVAIPDANFEQALIDMGIDSDGSLNGLVYEVDVQNLEVLDVSNKNISSLEGIQAFQNLKYLYAYNNQITSLDVSGNTELIHLSLNNNQLNSLDVTNNSLLNELHINNNQIATLNLGNHHDLFKLHAGGNQITSIDLSGLPKLNSLILWGSQLNSIDLSSNLQLAELVIDDNNLTSLDISANPNIKFLFASNNQLTSLNISNGNNSNFTSPDWNDYSLVVQGNPDLSCIQVDAGMVEINHPDWAKDAGAIYSTNCGTKPEYVHIPDPNFEQALIDLGIDSDQALNGWLLLSDAENVTNLNLRLPVNFPYGGGNTQITNVNSSITDLTGIEAFINLEGLLVGFNDLESLDVTNLSKLTYLRASNNSLTEIDLSQNPQLKYLFLTNNELTQIDLSNNPNLTELEINYNQIAQIDVSGNPLLKVLQFLDNPISSIDTHNLLQLETLSCGKTNITSLDLSNNLKLKNLNIDELPIHKLDLSLYPDFERLWARNTPLSSLDFSKNPNLVQVWIEYSPLKILDLSNNHALFALVLDNNPALEHLDLRNGNNAAMNFFRLNNTPNLTCINADGTISQAMTDSGKSFSTDCGDFVEIPDPNFEQALIDLGIDSDGVVNSTILRRDAEVVTGQLNISGKGIEDLTGIEAFVNITELQAGDNNLTSIDVSKNVLLEKIWVYYNQLTSLDLSACVKMQRISAGGNQISSVNFTNLVNVNTVYLWENSLSNIDLTGMTSLERLDLSDNLISNIDLSNNLELKWLRLYNLKLDEIDVSNNLKLDWFDVGNNPLSSLDVTSNTLLSDLRLNNTQIERIDLNNNPELQTLIGIGSKIKVLDFSNNPIFYQLNVNNNLELESLDLRNGNNINVDVFRLLNTPKLTCINADENISQAMTDSGKSFSTDCGDFVEIPDANFEQSLIDIGIDSDGVINRKILRSDAIATTGILNVSYKNISDLTGIEAFVNIEKLYCQHNQITTIDLSDNSELALLAIWNNQLNALDLSSNLKFKDLYADNNSITNVTFAESNLVERINLRNNSISNFDFSSCPNLIQVDIAYSNISSVDFTQNLALSEAYLSGLGLERIDLSKNLNLKAIDLYGNNVSVIDLSNNSSLTYFYASNCPLLSHLDFRNGNNLSVTTFALNNTPSLGCINADENISQVMINSGKSFSTDCGDFVQIPDANFEQALIDLGIDSDGVVNTSILREDAEVVTELNLNNPLFDNSSFANTQIVNVSGKIADLTGIEAFVNLKNLQAAYGELTAVDLSANTQLEELFLNDNQLSSVDVSMLTSLKRFGIMRNPITSEIDISNNPALEELFVHETGINTIDLSANVNLWNLYIQNNDLTSLDVSANTALKRVSCQNNQLSDFNITTLSVIERIDAQYNANMTLTTGASGNPTLTSLNLSGTGLSNFNGAPYPNLQWLLLNQNNLSNFNGNNNLNLQNLFLNGNAIAKLNLSGNAQLTQLQVMNNGLEELDLRNGNNAILSTMKATGNLLTCMSVDDPTDNSLPYASWEVDMGVVFSSNCKQAPEVILIPDPNFEQALIDLGIDTNGENGALTGNILLSEAEAVISLDVSGKSITDAAGIQGFVNLTGLNISNNSLTEINLVDNSALVSLNVSGNTLTNLFVASGKNLLSLHAENNNLQQLNIADLTNLEVLNISGNSFESLNLSGLSNLISIDVSENDLTKLDLRNGNNSAIGFMDATGNPLLQCIGVDDASSIPSGWSIDPATSYTNSGDCEAPVVITKDITVSLDRYGQVSISPLDVDNGSSDNVSLQRDLIFDLSQSNFDCANLGENEVILSVSDEFGNTASATAIVNVIDEIAPTASSLHTYQLDLAGAASVNLDASDINDGSSDNCNDLYLTIDQSSFSFPGVYSVTLTVTDASGNSDSSTTDVEVIDSQKTPVSLKFNGNLVATVYPNPFTSYLRIAFSKSVDLNTVDVAIFTLGNSRTSVSFVADGNELVSNDTGILQAATYILSITINGQTQTAMIIKE